MHKGVCVGGPMAGQAITTRSDAGFVVVDAAGFAVWIYVVDVDGKFRLGTRTDPPVLDDSGTRALDREAAVTLAGQCGLDVIALPGEDDEPAADPPAIDESADDEDGDF
jgi:hypothetical protein